MTKPRRFSHSFGFTAAAIALLAQRGMAQAPSPAAPVAQGVSEREPQATASTPPHVEAQTGSQDPGYTLNVGTRLVVEDVSVIDRKGNAVTGLPQSAFHVQDNKAPQRIVSFGDVADGAPSAPQPSPAGSYSNAALYRSTHPVVVMLFDPLSIELPDQMYLRLQMLQYLKSMAPDMQVAVFRANSRGIPVLLQSLTSDRALLRAAIDRSVPTMARPGSDVFANAVAELENLSDYLRAVPGKKALLWFSGRFPLFVDPSVCGATGGSNRDCGSLDAVRKDAFRALEQARIAVYPIDARGVVAVEPGISASTASSGASTPLAGSGLPTTIGGTTIGQYEGAEELANATGGWAYHSNNALAAAVSSAVALGSHAYTLAYRPEPYSTDDTWHSVRITVDGGYSVSYRSGYYAAANGPSSTRTRLTTRADGTDHANAPDAQTAAPTGESDAPPLIFSAALRPDGMDGKKLRYTIAYTIPATELFFATQADGTHHALFRLAAMAYNSEGDPLGYAVDTVETHYSADQMTLAARVGTPANQAVEAPRGAEFLLLAVQDLNQQRVGTVQMPLREVKAGESAAR